MNRTGRFGLMLLMVCLTAGCAEVTQKTYAPDGGNHAGTVRYGTDWFMGAKNRAAAVKQMRDYCGANQARLLAEDSHAEFLGYSDSQTSYAKHGSYTSTMSSKGHYTYLHFKCVKRKA